MNNFISFLCCLYISELAPTFGSGEHGAAFELNWEFSAMGRKKITTRMQRAQFNDEAGWPGCY